MDRRCKSRVNSFRLLAAIGLLLVAASQSYAYKMGFEWYAHSASAKFKITRTLNGGSGIVHRVGTFKAVKVCNGGGFDSDGVLHRFCRIPADTDYTYQIHEITEDGDEINLTVCTPVAADYNEIKWSCGKAFPH